MDKQEFIRKPFLLCFLALLFFLLLSVAVHAEDEVDTSFAGVYQVAGTTSEGDDFSTTVIVRPFGEGIIQFQAKTPLFPVTTRGPATWVSPDEVRVPVSIYLLIGSGSGTITLTRAATGWNLFGTGSGYYMSEPTSGTIAGTGGGVHPTRSQVSDVTGVSPTVLAIDEAVKPLTPEPEQRDLDTGERAAAIIFTLFYIFILIFLSLILGLPYPL